MSTFSNVEQSNSFTVIIRIQRAGFSLKPAHWIGCQLRRKRRRKLIVKYIIYRIVHLLVLVDYVRHHLYRCGHNPENCF
jgi:hypothetical protein